MAVARRLGHDRVEPGRVQVRRDRHASAARRRRRRRGRRPRPRPGRRAACRCRRPRSSSLRQMRATTREIEASTLARPMVAVSDSRVNHDTRMPASMTAWARASTKWLLPVPMGPLRARFSARPTHSSVRRRRLGGGRDGGVLRPPAVEGLARGEPGRLAPHALGGGVAAGDLLDEQDPQHLGRVPALGPGGGQHLGGGGAHVGQAHAPQHGGELLGDRRRRRRRLHRPKPVPGAGAGLGRVGLIGGDELDPGLPPVQVVEDRGQVSRRRSARPGRPGPAPPRRGPAPTRAASSTAWAILVRTRAAPTAPPPPASARPRRPGRRRRSRPRVLGLIRRRAGPVAAGVVGVVGVDDLGVAGRGQAVAGDLDQAFGASGDDDQLLAHHPAPHLGALVAVGGRVADRAEAHGLVVADQAGLAQRRGVGPRWAARAGGPVPRPASAPAAGGSRRGAGR